MTRKLLVAILTVHSLACSGDIALEELTADGGLKQALDTVEEAIVGGQQAGVGEWPTAVSVDYTRVSGPWWCGGTVIAPRVILTAKHCTDGTGSLDGLNIPASELRVVVGRHDLTTSTGTVHNVSSIVRHSTQDVALLNLSTTISGVKPSRLIAAGRMGEIPNGSVTTVVGWGRLQQGGQSSNTLQEVDVEVVGIGAQCEAVTDYPLDGITVGSHEICIGEMAGGQDSCQGDSGGPVFVRRDGEWFLLGVTSEGWGCAQPNLPGIYAHSPAFFSWMHSNASGEPAPSWLSSAQILTTQSVLFL